MSARRGTLTFLRYFVEGKPPRDLRQRYLQAVRLRVFTPLKPEDEATEASGWCVMERPFDLDIGMHNLYADRFVLLGLRVDRWRVPSSVVQSQLVAEEQRLLAKSGRPKLGRQEKKELKQRIVQRLRRKLLPATKAFDVCWDLDAGTVLLFSHSRRLSADFAALFEKTFALRLVEDSPYGAAQRSRPSLATSRVLDGVPPVSYSAGRKRLARASGAPSATSVVVASKEPAPESNEKPKADAGESEALIERIEGTRFLGPELLLWLWLRTQLVEGPLTLGEHGDYEVWIERQIVLESALDPNERVIVRGAAPADSSEAREAVKAQKFPVRARLVLQGGQKDFACVLDAPRFAIGAGVVPAVLNEQTDEAFLERMELVEQLTQVLDAVYGLFLEHRLTPHWQEGWEPALVAWFEGEPIPPKVLQRLQAPVANAKRPAKNAARRARSSNQ
ncbi:MAG TPA: recombination-associated protein RdgC [Polyangiaceae bacterium]|nr:recombination-associated protein RdgC [Polyangiaceae bacterium]